MSDNGSQCYTRCNENYSLMDPGRLFCKKGCDSQEDTLSLCKQNTCNKLCIKEQQGEQKLLFNFLYRAPIDAEPCLNACIQGCNQK